MEYFDILSANIFPWHVFAFAFIIYVIYYFIEVVKRPILAVSDGEFKRYLQKNVPTLENKFWPTFWCFESRLQTVFASVLRSKNIPDIDYDREVLALSDGGQVALDWFDIDCGENSPVIIILPGLTGSSQDEYIKCLVIAANHCGLRTVVFNNRGLGGIELKTSRLYCAANCDDMYEVVHHVSDKYPTAKLGATGISMGGLVLGNYLTSHSEEARKYLTAANIISVPWNAHKCTENMEKPVLNYLIGRHLTGCLCSILSSWRHLIHDANIDIDHVLTAKTIKEFDDMFTSKHFGYVDAFDYYNNATIHNKLDNISVPLLSLSAADDPFQPLEAIPIKEAKKSSHVAILVTARGGHIGFLEGWWPISAKEQYMGRLFSEYFSKALIDEDGEFEKVSQHLMEDYRKNNPTLTK